MGCWVDGIHSRMIVVVQLPTMGENANATVDVPDSKVGKEVPPDINAGIPLFSQSMAKSM